MEYILLLIILCTLLIFFEILKGAICTIFIFVGKIEPKANEKYMKRIYIYLNIFIFISTLFAVVEEQISLTLAVIVITIFSIYSQQILKKGDNNDKN